VPQSADLDSPRPIATTVSPPIFLTSMTPAGKFQTYPAYIPDVHISADLVHATSPSPRSGGAPVSAGIGSTAGLVVVGRNGQNGDGEAGKDVHNMMPNTASSTSDSGGSGEHFQVQTAVLEPGSFGVNNKELEEAMFQLSDKQLPGAQRARAAIAAVGDPQQPEESSLSSATSATTRSMSYRRAHAWEFGL